MSDLSHCTAPNDYTPYHGGFRGHFRVNNATNSTYSNLYLNPPANTEWGIATLTSEPQRTWSMDGGIRWVRFHISSFPGHLCYHFLGRSWNQYFHYTSPGSLNYIYD